MKLSCAIIETVSSNTKFICLTGGGGKTSLMQLLASEYKNLGKKVLMTTSTKIQSPDNYAWQADYIFTTKTAAMFFIPVNPCTVLYAENQPDIGKMVAPETDVLKELSKKYDVVICEADGSKHMPVKWHTDKDPVVPDFTSYTISVMGAWAEHENLQKYVDDEQGLLKGSIKNNRMVLINGNEDGAIIFSNIQWPSDCVIIEGSVVKNELYKRN